MRPLSCSLLGKQPRKGFFSHGDRSSRFLLRGPQLTAFALTFLLLQGTTQQLLADCCNDVWSCGAAIATDGLSCVIEGLIDTVNNLVKQVQDLRNIINGQTGSTASSAQQAVNDASDILSQGTQKSADDERRAADQALRIAAQEASSNVHLNQPKGGAQSGSATNQSAKNVTTSGGNQPSKGEKPPASLGKPGTIEAAPGLEPADENEIKEEMIRAKEKVEELDKEAKQQEAEAEKKAQMAKDQAAGSVQAGLDLGNKLAVAPLDGLANWLHDLLSHPDKIFDPTSIIDSELNTIVNNLTNTLDQIADAVAGKANETLQSAQPDYEALQKQAEQQQEIANEMDRLHRERTREALGALEASVPPPHVLHLKPVTKQKPAVQATPLAFSAILSRMNAGRQKAVAEPKQRLQAMSLHIERLKTIRLTARNLRASLPEYRKNFAQHMDTYFAQKSPADIAKQRDLLVAEARTRFAKDPRTRDAVIQLFNNEAQRRMAARHSPN